MGQTDSEAREDKGEGSTQAKDLSRGASPKLAIQENKGQPQIPLTLSNIKAE